MSLSEKLRKEKRNMKYLMGLLISCALGASAIAQNNMNVTGSDGASKKSRCERATNKNKMKTETGSSSRSQTYSGMSAEEQMVVGEGQRTVQLNPGLDVTYGFENGSVQYSRSPLNNTGYVSSVSERGSKNVRTRNSSLGLQCGINEVLNSKEGAFKEKMNYADGKLEVKKEKSGEAKVRYKSNNEFYELKRDKNGREAFVHSLQRGENEIVELQKNKDGSASIYYEGFFENTDEANQALNEGLIFEDVASACVE